MENNTPDESVRHLGVDHQGAMLPWEQGKWFKHVCINEDENWFVVGPYEILTKARPTGVCFADAKTTKDIRPGDILRDEKKTQLISVRTVDSPTVFSFVRMRLDLNPPKEESDKMPTESSKVHHIPTAQYPGNCPKCGASGWETTSTKGAKFRTARCRDCGALIEEHFRAEVPNTTLGFDESKKEEK